MYVDNKSNQNNATVWNATHEYYNRYEITIVGTIGFQVGVNNTSVYIVDNIHYTEVGV